MYVRKTEYIAMEKGDHAISIFIELWKVFDIIDHRILFYELYYYGVCYPAYDLFVWLFEW